MKTFLRGISLGVAMAAVGMAATVTFTGTGVSGTGTFSSVGPNTTISGSVTIESAGPDQVADNPNNDGQYSLLVGGLQFDISGLGLFTFTASPLLPVTLRTFNVSEGIDYVELEANGGIFGQVLVTFFGDSTEQFVTAPAGANGLDALNQINWAHFASGNVTISSVVGPTSETSTVGAFELPQGDASFTIDAVNPVPEPGTALVVLVGAAAVVLKRRSA